MLSLGNAQKLFGTSWNLYATGVKNQAVALPVDTPKLPSGLAGNVDVVSGLGLYVTTHVSASARAPLHPGEPRTDAVGSPRVRTSRHCVGTHISSGIAACSALRSA